MANFRGVDLPKEQRPGVPMETPPRPAGHAHWKRPEPMKPESLVLRRAGLDHLTPVFSNANPPRGVSGLIRRAAYGIPEHKPVHWMLLLLADRVDVIESSPIKSALAVGALAAMGVGIYLLGRPRRASPLRLLF